MIRQSVEAERTPEGVGASPITVRDALDLPVMRRGVPNVVAGREHLDRPIRWVHAGEVPNMASLLKGGELLLTTGMGIGTSRTAQQRFVAGLAVRNVAALAIELVTTFKRMPPAVVTEAERVGLPLIALHEEVPFVQITEAIHREIVNHQYMLMRRGDELHARFTGLMLGGAGIADVLGVLSDTIANPVLLEKTGQGILYHATHVATDHEVLAGWDSVRRGIAEAPVSFSVPVPSAGLDTWGRLVAMELDSPLDDFDRVAVERAVGVIALTLIRNRQEEMLAARERGNFFDELLTGAVDETDARQRTRVIGFRGPSETLLPVVVGHPPSKTVPAAGEEATWALIARDLRRDLERDGVPVIAGLQPHERRILMAIGVSDRDVRAPIADRIFEATKGAIQRQLGLHARWTMSVGPLCGSWTHLREGLFDALEAVPAALSVQGEAWHDATRPDLRRLLWELGGARELRRFAERRLAPLLEHDSRRKVKLLPTLEAYLACGGRKAETARQLHLERQSLYHRLSRIKELLEDDLDDGDTRLGLHLAIRALGFQADASEHPQVPQ